MSQVEVTQVAVELMVPFVEGNAAVAGVQTTRFDDGEGSEWYVVFPIVDSGDELRSKLIKAAHALGRFTNAEFMIYGYDVGAGVDLSALEAGTGSITGAVPISDSTLVAQSERVQVNVPNACSHTIRISGDDRGQAVRDQLHEAVYEVAQAGVRR